MKKYSGLVAALVFSCFALGPLANSWAQDTRNAKAPKIISKEEAAKKYPPPNGKSYPPGSDLAILTGGAGGGSTWGYIKSPYSSNVYDCRKGKAHVGDLILDESVNKVFVRPQ
ncbi:MAG TPA: hypothetical protein VN827_02455 [Chthoniobacterales bacterium]|nr:hypothetical protein [Chthoniobacterales bacterium]